jgi:hypothetical protein
MCKVDPEPGKRRGGKFVVKPVLVIAKLVLEGVAAAVNSL